MIVVACKAESTVMSSEAVAEILDPFHVGLVEAMATSEKGKNKMRMALAWIIQVSKFMEREPRSSSPKPQAVLRRRGGLRSSASIASASSTASQTI